MIQRSSWTSVLVLGFFAQIIPVSADRIGPNRGFVQVRRGGRTVFVGGERHGWRNIMPRGRVGPPQGIPMAKYIPQYLFDGLVANRMIADLANDRTAFDKLIHDYAEKY